MNSVDAAIRAENRYGPVIRLPESKLVWKGEFKWMTLVQLPKIFHLVTNSNTGKTWDKVYCNIDIVTPLVNTIELLHFKGVLKELKTFDGCFNIREKRGLPGTVSLHTYGIALDLNASDNPLNGESKWSDKFVDTWMQMGWTWGGNFQRKDPMHFEYTSHLVKPQLVA